MQDVRGGEGPVPYRKGKREKMQHFSKSEGDSNRAIGMKYKWIYDELQHTCKSGSLHSNGSLKGIDVELAW